MERWAPWSRVALVPAGANGTNLPYELEADSCVGKEGLWFPRVKTRVKFVSAIGKLLAAGSSIVSREGRDICVSMAGCGQVEPTSSQPVDLRACDRSCVSSDLVVQSGAE